MIDDALIESFRLAHKASADAYAYSVVKSLTEALDAALKARDAWTQVAGECSRQLTTGGLMESAASQVLGEPDE